MKFYYKISIAISVSIFYKIKGARKRQKSAIHLESEKNSY